MTDPAPQTALPDLWRQDNAGIAAPRALRRLLLAVVALFLVLLALAATVPIDGAVIGAGQITVDTRVKRVAHPTGGVIGAILVHNGDHVVAGQVLLRLDDRVTGADARLADLTVDQLLAQQARAQAERQGLAAIVFPAELTGAGTPSAARAMDDERRLFALHRSEERGMQAQLAARVLQDNAEIHGFEAQIAALNEQRRLIERERQGVRDLWDKQLVTISRMNQLDRTAVDLDGSRGSLEAQIAQTRAKIIEAREQAIQLTQTRRVAAGNELAQINTQLNQQQIRRVTANDSRDRSDVRAPYAGTVEKIAFAAVGDVIRPAEPILEIVPDHDAMVVEAMISPAQIDQVRAGLDARIRLPGLNRAATPELPGRVIYVATDRTENADTHQVYYLARVAIDPSALAQPGFALKSGMPAEVHIAAGRRSLLSYLMKPLRDQFARAFRDS
jgi:HlyD family secretion protein